jgi:hypothetical protein
VASMRAWDSVSSVSGLMLVENSAGRAAMAFSSAKRRSRTGYWVGSPPVNGTAGTGASSTWRRAPA